MIRPIAALLFGAAMLQGAWQAGAAKVSITPGEPVWMGGYAARTKPSEGIRQEIFAKALALKDDSGRISVIVTLDLIHFRSDLPAAVAARVRERHGIPRERLLFNASHTHSSPVVAVGPRFKEQMGAEVEARMAAVKRYVDALPGKINQAIDHAIAGLEPAALSFEQGFAGFAVNRRRVGQRHLPGPVDHDVPVLLARNASGRALAVLFGYACHNTVLSDYLISGDYAGYAQEAVEAKFPGSVALFVQGAGADANPLPRRSEELARRYGLTLADAVAQVVDGKTKPISGALTCALESVDLHFQGPPTREQLKQRLGSGDPLVRSHAARLLEQLEREGRIIGLLPYPVQAWQFGKQLTLLALGGELVVDYSLRFKAKYGWDNLWVAGYSNDVFGYVPSLRVLKEGGYEGGGAMLSGYFPGPFREDVEDIIVRKVDEVIGKVRAGSAARK